MGAHERNSVNTPTEIALLSADWLVSETIWDEVFDACEANAWGVQAAPPWGIGRIVYAANNATLLLMLSVEAHGAKRRDGGIDWCIEPSTVAGPSPWTLLAWDEGAAEYVEIDGPIQALQALSQWWRSPAEVMPAPVVDELLAA